TAWLYRTKSLRDKIMKARNTSPAVGGEVPQHRLRLSHERVVATLRLRIRTLEEINGELKERLEATYGRLAVAQTKLGSCTEPQNDALITCDRCSEAFPGT
ncbi:MAG: hypothetical protein WBV36_15600, partial [Terriglobales bacterium]